MTRPIIPPPPGAAYQGHVEVTGRRMALGILMIASIVGGLIGISFAGAYLIAAWAGIVLPLGVFAVVVAALLVWIATKESGW